MIANQQCIEASMVVMIMMITMVTSMVHMVVRRMLIMGVMVRFYIVLHGLYWFHMIIMIISIIIITIIIIIIIMIIIIWGHMEVILGSSGGIFSSSVYRFRVIVGSLWYHMGIILARFLVWFLSILLSGRSEPFRFFFFLRQPHVYTYIYICIYLSGNLLEDILSVAIKPFARNDLLSNAKYELCLNISPSDRCREMRKAKLIPIFLACNAKLRKTKNNSNDCDWRIAKIEKNIACCFFMIFFS